jgi:hypothetical protein
MTEPLSPAAQAVLSAANASATNAWSDATHQRFRSGVAAALRAAADAIEPIDITPDHEWLLEQLLAIAAELEGEP